MLTRVCPVLYLSSQILTTLSTLHECNIHILVKLSQPQWLRSDARWWKGAAFTEKMNAGFDDDELEFTAVDVEPISRAMIHTRVHSYQAERVQELS